MFCPWSITVKLVRASWDGSPRSRSPTARLVKRFSKFIRPTVAFRSLILVDTLRNSAPNLMKCAPRLRLNVARGFQVRGVWNCGVDVCRPTASKPWMLTFGTPPTIAGSFGTFFRPTSAAPSTPKFGGYV